MVAVTHPARDTRRRRGNARQFDCQGTLHIGVATIGTAIADSEPVSMLVVCAESVFSNGVMISAQLRTNLLCCLLATAIAGQPSIGFSCACGNAKSFSAMRLPRRTSDGSPSHAPVAEGDSGCCCMCCATRQAGEGAANSKCAVVCRCVIKERPLERRSPRPLPSERSWAIDLLAAVFSIQIDTLELPNRLLGRRDVRYSAEFASAAAHCIALCRLRF